MSRKVEMINSLFESGHAQELCELLKGVSRTGGELPSIELTRLVATARLHLEFVSRHGVGKSHVLEGTRHSFAYPDRYSEWLSQDAPGVDADDLQRLYESLV